MERFKVTPEVFVILMREGNILLLRRANTGWQDGNYSLPAGHLESGETAREGASREAKEEVGIDIDPNDLEFLLTQYRWHVDHGRVGFYFAPKKWSGEIRNAEPDKADDLQFFPIDTLPENMVEHVREALKSFIEGESYCEHGWQK